MDKKRVLFISPAFANGGVVCKYDKRYIDAWRDLCDFTIATKRIRNKSDLSRFELIECADFFSYEIQILQGRYFNGYEPIVPDGNRLTIKPFLLRLCRKYLQSHKVHVIHTVSFPCSSHLIGYELKKEFRVPWIAHFYDPWVDNPLRNIPDSKRQFDAEMESLVAHDADAIIHSNSVIRDCWVERYGDIVKDKIHIVPFGYSSEQVKDFMPFNGRLPQSDKVIMSYIGTCAGDRNFQSLIKAVDYLYNRYPECQDKLEIRLLGNLLDCDKDLIESKKLGHIMKYIGRKTQDELPKYYQESDVFIVIDSPQKRNVFFPSKLVDYFFYQRPILGISPKLGVTNEFLTASGNSCFENNDIEGIAGYLQTAISNFPLLLSFDKNYYQNFLPDSINNKYKQILNYIFQASNIPLNI